MQLKWKNRFYLAPLFDYSDGCCVLGIIQKPSIKIFFFHIYFLWCSKIERKSSCVHSIPFEIELNLVDKCHWLCYFIVYNCAYINAYSVRVSAPSTRHFAAFRIGERFFSFFAITLNSVLHIIVDLSLVRGKIFIQCVQVEVKSRDEWRVTIF